MVQMAVMHVQKVSVLNSTSVCDEREVLSVPSRRRRMCSKWTSLCSSEIRIRHGIARRRIVRRRRPLDEECCGARVVHRDVAYMIGKRSRGVVAEVRPYGSISLSMNVPRKHLLRR